MHTLTHLLLKLPRNVVVTPEAAQTFLSALTQINYVPKLTKLFGKRPHPLALEIVFSEGQIGFYISCEATIASFVETQIQSSYPLVAIEKAKTDPYTKLGTDFALSYLRPAKGNFYPIATYEGFSDIDPLASLLSILAKTDPTHTVVLQIALEAIHVSWQTSADTYANKGEKQADGSYGKRADAAIIKEKVTYPGFGVSLRLAASNQSTLSELASAYGVFTRPDGNSLYANTPTFLNKKDMMKNFLSRKVAGDAILNIRELATLWHLPSEKVKTQGIVWGKNVLSDPPEALPIASNFSEEEKLTVNFFAKTQFRNQDVTFGIKDRDRLRHIWTVGKTGSGKSTMLENMAIDDLKKGRGMGFIDPHGDACEHMLEYIPKSRINDVVYFNPADRDHPITINPLEVTNREEAELVVSGLMAIFTKIWANVWSARMEYILRNSFMTLTEVPGSTLADVLTLLSVKGYRDRVLSQVKDPAIMQFWVNEFNVMPEDLQKEAIAPIQNKVGQFVTSPLIRRIIGTPKSSVSIKEIMDGKKILLANLSQGRLGEDNAALLGAMLITKFQLAAMSRVDTPTDDRVPFYLFVDEFQNFATESFIKILSEARKYGLALTLANQYMAQVPPEIQKAILGNAGTLISFGVGAEDAAVIFKEFAEVFTQNDLVNLSNHQIAIKLMIDGHTSRPFIATTLPLPQSKNQGKDKVIRTSQERYATKAKDKLVDSQLQSNKLDLLPIADGQSIVHSPLTMDQSEIKQEVGSKDSLLTTENANSPLTMDNSPSHPTNQKPETDRISQLQNEIAHINSKDIDTMATKEAQTSGEIIETDTERKH
jgi:Type IV secretion-system coupling protein DNA-binding domain